MDERLMILTLSHPLDIHAFAVQECLRRKGSDTVLWLTTELAQRQRAAIETDGGTDFGWRVAGDGLELDVRDFDVVWFRRAERPVITEDLHPADRGFAEREYDEFFRWMIELVPSRPFWVNPLASTWRARSKIEQQRVARRVGLRIPRTLYTNDPGRVRAFLREAGGRIVYKPFRQQGPWMMGDWGSAQLFTSVLTEARLPDDDVLRATPGIYQPYLEKAYELRITVVGRYVFPARLDSQATEGGRVDWRRGISELRCEAAEIPHDLERKMLRMMYEMELVYGCFDFIVTPRGEHHFLEVNDMGQFLFVEADTGQPILDAFCEMLLQRRPDFRWQASGALPYKDLEEKVVARRFEAERRHIGPRERIAGTEEAPA